MQYRCYTCGFVFADGPPPLEALSDQQMGLVQGSRSEVEDIRLLLLGTVYEGLGAANFCDTCLLAIVDNPAAFRKGEQTHILDQDHSAVWCRCGVTYDTTDTGRYAMMRGRDWVEINRLRMRHISDA